MRKCGLCLLGLLLSVHMHAQVNHVVISQVYGGGGNTSAPFTHDFIELFNPTGSVVNLTGWSIQYASAGSVSGTLSGSSAITVLNGTIQPGQYLLIQGASGGVTGMPLPAADITGSINLSATNGKIWLCNSSAGLSISSTGCPVSSASIIDQLGFGTANCFEGFAAIAATNTTSLIRNNNGCTDENINGTDFSRISPLPRNSISVPVYCYATQFEITSIVPATPIAGGSFEITVQAKNAGGSPSSVISNTVFSISSNGNAGLIQGTGTGVISAGTHSVTVTGIILPLPGNGVTVTVTRISGDNLANGTSALFNVSDPVILPVHFGGIKATKNSGGIIISWTNYSESGISRYEIEKSFNGVDFFTRGIQFPNGNLNERASYSWMDSSGITDPLFYRITAIEQNGSRISSWVVKLRNIYTTRMRIFPNPVEKGNIHISVENTIGGTYTFKVFDLAGTCMAEKIIIHRSGDLDENIQLKPYYKPGMYICRITGSLSFSLMFLVR